MTLQEATLEIRKKELLFNEGKSYSLAIQTLQAAATKAFKDARTYTLGIMAALGFQEGGVIRNVATSQVAVVCYLGDNQTYAMIGFLTKKGYVSNADKFYHRITPRNYQYWQRLGYSVEPDPKRIGCLPYWGVLVPTDKRTAR